MHIFLLHASFCGWTMVASKKTCLFATSYVFFLRWHWHTSASFPFTSVTPVFFCMRAFTSEYRNALNTHTHSPLTLKFLHVLLLNICKELFTHTPSTSLAPTISWTHNHQDFMPSKAIAHFCIEYLHLFFKQVLIQHSLLARKHCGQWGYSNKLNRTSLYLSSMRWIVLFYCYEQKSDSRKNKSYWICYFQCTVWPLALASPGSPCEMQSISPMPCLQKQNLHFVKIPGQREYTLMFKKHWKTNRRHLLGKYIIELFNNLKYLSIILTHDCFNTILF